MADDLIPDAIRMRLLTDDVTSMFCEAAGLPGPGSMIVFGILNGHVHDSVSLQFAPVKASANAVTEWGLRFGGVIQSSNEQGKDGPELWVRTDFTWHGLKVCAYAHIPLPETEATPIPDRSGTPEAALPS